MMKEQSSPRRTGTRKYTPETLVAIGHPTRKRILEVLAKRKQISTPELEKEANESRYNLYHHLEVLKKAGLVDSQIIGRVKHFNLVADVPRGIQPIQVDLRQLSVSDRRKACQAVEQLVLYGQSSVKQVNCEALRQVTLVLEYHPS